MGLFGKKEKKSPAEYIAEGRALFDQGRYGKAVFALLKASGKENGEGRLLAGPLLPGHG